MDRSRLRSVLSFGNRKHEHDFVDALFRIIAIWSEPVEDWIVATPRINVRKDDVIYLINQFGVTHPVDRKMIVEGQRVLVGVQSGGSRIIKKKKIMTTTEKINKK